MTVVKVNPADLDESAGKLDTVATALETAAKQLTGARAKGCPPRLAALLIEDMRKLHRTVELQARTGRRRAEARRIRAALFRLADGQGTERDAKLLLSLLFGKGAKRSPGQMSLSEGLFAALMAGAPAGVNRDAALRRWERFWQLQSDRRAIGSGKLGLDALKDYLLGKRKWSDYNGAVIKGSPKPTGAVEIEFGDGLVRSGGQPGPSPAELEFGGGTSRVKQEFADGPRIEQVLGPWTGKYVPPVAATPGVPAMHLPGSVGPDHIRARQPWVKAAQ